MDGVLIIDKPKGYTSHDIVNIVRKELKTKKVGHAGTLDPNATGVLPVLIGQATKISKYLIEHNKKYIATLKLGEERDTDDEEGKIVKKDINCKNLCLTKQKILEVLETFKDKQMQVPPIYSSIKVNGKKAYEYAREGQALQLNPREIEIYDINLIEIIEDEIIFEVFCSKGTYIRALCRDIAKKLGTYGYMKDLRRTEVDSFKLNDAITIENIADASNKIISIETIFKDKNKVKLNEKDLKLFLNGVQLNINEPNDIYRIYENNNFIGLGIINEKKLKRDIIIN